MRKNMNEYKWRVVLIKVNSCRTMLTRFLVYIHGEYDWLVTFVLASPISHFCVIIRWIIIIPAIIRIIMSFIFIAFPTMIHWIQIARPSVISMLPPNPNYTTFANSKITYYDGKIFFLTTMFPEMQIYFFGGGGLEFVLNKESHFNFISWTRLFAFPITLMSSGIGMNPSVIHFPSHIQGYRY